MTDLSSSPNPLSLKYSIRYRETDTIVNNILVTLRFNPHARVGRDCLCFYDMCFNALIGVKCECVGLHMQKYSFFIEFASNILIIKWCERIGISAMLMVLVYIIRSALKLKELSIPMCSTFPSQ